MNRQVKFQKSFSGDGSDFSAYSEAEQFTKKHGFSIGSMQREAPIGLVKESDVYIPKWRNMSTEDLEVLDGVIRFPKGESPRNGTAIVELYIDFTAEKSDKIELEKPLEKWIQLSGDIDGRNGLIDEKGRWYPCEFMGHNDLYDELKELGLPETLLEAEERWIKVSTGIFLGMTVFVTTGKVITGKQKMTIEKFLTIHPNVSGQMPSKSIDIGPYNTIYIEDDGKFRWVKEK